MHEPSIDRPVVSMVDQTTHPAPKERIKKKSSLRSLFSVFRSSNPDPKTHAERDSFLAKVTLSFSTNSLPSQVQPQQLEKRVGGSSPSYVHGASTVSLPDDIRPPFSNTASSSSSSSSASSLDFESDASTTMTTPSNSSLSVLMKTPDLPPPAPQQIEKNRPGVPRNPSLSKKPKRAPDIYRKQPSPLSTVTDAQPYPYVLPAPPASILHERPNSFQPKRRNSLGRLLTRGYRSSPDLSLSFDDDDDMHALPMMIPLAPVPRPLTTASSPERLRTLRARTRDNLGMRADLKKPTAYSTQERMEHRSILGADPAGLGFYLYPKPSQPEQPSQRPNVGYGGRNGCLGVGGDMGHGRRGLREPRGRNFRRNVATQIIMEEEGNDTYEEMPVTNRQRRHSAFHPHDGQWRQPAPPNSANALRPPALPSIDRHLDGNSSTRVPVLEESRSQSLHNNWDHITTQMEPHPGRVSALEVLREDTHDRQPGQEGEETALRSLQQEAMRFMNGSDLDNGKEFDDGSRSQQITNGTAKTPAINVEMADT